MSNKVFLNADVTAQLGLDLRGGMQVVLQAPEGYQIDQETLQVALLHFGEPRQCFRRK